MNITDTYLEEIRQTILWYFEDEDVSIALFGSRARGESRSGSDVDVAIIPHNGYDRRKLIYLRERLEQMNIPYKVELVEWNELSDSFRNQVLDNSVWWKGQR